MFRTERRKHPATRKGTTPPLHSQILQILRAVHGQCKTNGTEQHLLALLLFAHSKPDTFTCFGFVPRRKCLKISRRFAYPRVVRSETKSRIFLFEFDTLILNSPKV